MGRTAKDSFRTGSHRPPNCRPGCYQIWGGLICTSVLRLISTKQKHTENQQTNIFVQNSGKI